MIAPDDLVRAERWVNTWLHNEDPICDRQFIAQLLLRPWPQI